MLELLKRKTRSAEDLLSVVKTMKVLAAVSIQQYEKAVESLGEYNRSVEFGLQAVLKYKSGGILIAKPVLKEKLGVIVFGSDQGMVGQFNEVIAHYAAEGINTFKVKQKNRMVIAVGVRAMSCLEEAGQSVEDCLSLPGSITAIAPVVQDIVLKMEAWRFKQQVDRIVIFYNRTVGASYKPHRLQLLPVDYKWFQELKSRPWPSRCLPFFTMDWNRLFSSLIRQHLFVSVFQAFAESICSENAGRLVAMQAAEKNIEERLDELNFQFHQERHSSITEELLDIVAGFEALK
ncbi:MAG: F0F1 ATP synthase subunit gamma [Deltaproteobacteria bacterium]|nr:F0F1 ATP synthase subunit gamma [Deltaproteobacteria bacterium]